MNFSFGENFVDGHDVRMAQGASDAAFADEQAGLGGILAILGSQHLEGHDLAGFAMHGAIDARKSTSAHQVEDFVIAEEKA